MMVLNAQVFQRLLLRWFDRFGRKDLPWQKNKTPYRVWVSEIMLQQTQVSTVIPYFERFMMRFPDIKTLANASEDEVFHYWAGLGYYQRARHLHKAAKKLLDDFNGHFPDNLTDLEKIPGVGRSTAGAILSIAFGKKAPILDGNVKRVLTRLHGITDWPGEKKVLDNLWTLAEKYTSEKRPADYTQAIMDLGATVCVRSKPLCDQCLFVSYCVAHAKGITKSIPRAKPRKVLPIRQATLLVLRKKHFVLLEKRSKAGVWAGLWSLPEITGSAAVTAIREFCLRRFRFTVKDMQFGPQFRHTFSHYHLDILPVYLEVAANKSKIMEDDQQIWYNLQDSQKIGMPAPVKLLLKELETVS